MSLEKPKCVYHTEGHFFSSFRFFASESVKGFSNIITIHQPTNLEQLFLFPCRWGGRMSLKRTALVVFQIRGSRCTSQKFTDIVGTSNHYKYDYMKLTSGYLFRSRSIIAIAIIAVLLRQLHNIMTKYKYGRLADLDNMGNFQHANAIKNNSTRGWCCRLQIAWPSTG